MIEQHLPEVIIVGDIEMILLGMAVALGMPRMARRVLRRKFGTDDSERGEGAEEEQSR